MTVESSIGYRPQGMLLDLANLPLFLQRIESLFVFAPFYLKVVLHSTNEIFQDFFFKIAKKIDISKKQLQN